MVALSNLTSASSIVCAIFEASPNDGGFFPISLNDKIMFLAYNLKYYEKKYKTHWYLKKTIQMSSNL